MGIIFLASRLDEDKLRHEVTDVEQPLCAFSIGKPVFASTEEDLIVVVFSKTTVDSTAHQANVIDTIRLNPCAKFRKVCLDKVTVPKGFGIVSEAEEWSGENRCIKKG